jgi:hypothetical protein
VEAFLSWRTPRSCRLGRDGEVGAWLRRVGINLALNRLRSPGAPAHARGGTPRTPDEEPRKRPHRPRARCPPEERAVAARRGSPRAPARVPAARHSGYPIEIAATLDLAVGPVGVLLARAEHTFRATYWRQPTRDWSRTLPRYRRRRAGSTMKAIRASTNTRRLARCRRLVDLRGRSQRPRGRRTSHRSACRRRPRLPLP